MQKNSDKDDDDLLLPASDDIENDLFSLVTVPVSNVAVVQHRLDVSLRGGNRQRYMFNE